MVSLRGMLSTNASLGKETPFLPFLFLLVTDALSMMFTNALATGILYGVPLGNQGKMCHLQYADDMLLITTRGVEDLRIFKLFLYLFEGISRCQSTFIKASFTMQSTVNY